MHEAHHNLHNQEEFVGDFFLFGYFLLLFLSDLLLAVTSLSPHMQMQKKHSNTKLEDKKQNWQKKTKDQVKPLLTTA